jgi:hypothetical protein
MRLLGGALVGKLGALVRPARKVTT